MKVLQRLFEISIKTGGNFMKRKTMKCLRIGAMIVILAGILSSVSWSADKYPSRSVELVCGSSAGGGTDIANRILAKYFEKYLKVPFVPINKPGPSQMMMASYVATAKPDGYTIGHGSNAIVTAAVTGQATGYTMEDLRPVCMISTVNTMVAVPADSPWKTWQEFVEYAKKNPGTKYGHFGIGSGPHYRMEVLNKHNKLGLQGVPFKGEGEALPMLLGKHVPISPMSPTVAKEQLAAGKVRILFSFEDPTLDGFDKNIPSLNSLYGPNAPDIDTTVFIWVHRKTPEDIVYAIDQAFAKMVKDPDFVSEMKKINQLVTYVDSKDVEKNLAQQMIKYKQALDYLGLIKK
jgi:tripartite-type tricarboxylate transporter receptor subunit TctC